MESHWAVAEIDSTGAAVGSPVHEGYPEEGFECSDMTVDASGRKVLAPCGAAAFRFTIGALATRSTAPELANALRVIVKPNGQTIIAGFRTLKRLTAAGLDGVDVRDTGFGSTVLAVQEDDKILLAGTSAGNNPITVGRFNMDGTPDTSFGNGGTVRTDIPGMGATATDMALTADGKIVVVARCVPMALKQEMFVLRYWQ